MGASAASAVQSAVTLAARIDPVAAQAAAASAPPRSRSHADRAGTTPVAGAEETAGTASQALGRDGHHEGAVAEAVASRILRRPRRRDDERRDAARGDPRRAYRAAQRSAR
jgi:hypothetical protein